MTVIDCGQLDDIEGVEPLPPGVKTTFGGFANFTCKPLFTLKGKNKQVTPQPTPDYQINCLGSNWNLGTLRCEGLDL